MTKLLLSIIFLSGFLFSDLLQHIGAELLMDRFQECVRQGEPPGNVAVCAEMRYPIAYKVSHILEANLITKLMRALKND